MKANRKFLNGDNDEAVSPVIAVILMVAITVVLAATVYVWVSGFSGGGSPAKTISLSSASALTSGAKSFAVASATSGMKWSDVTFTINGVSRALDTNATGCDTTPPVAAAGTYLACAGTTEQTGTLTIDAGDMVYLGGLNSGDTLRILDAQANSVIYTLAVG